MKIIIKIGSNVLLGNKQALDLELMEKIVEEISQLHQKGYQIIIITSGAVATGGTYLKDKDALRSTSAAVGQAELIYYYWLLFDKNNIKIAQILLSVGVFKSRARYENLKETLQRLTEESFVPIVNENDVIVFKDTFGDNDILAAMIAVMSHAQKLVFLTNLDGLYSADPKIDQSAQIVKQVKSIDLEIQKMCSKTTSSFGCGGMTAKLKAIKLAIGSMIETYIINGLQPDNINKLLVKNQAIGTKFLAR